MENAVVEQAIDNTIDDLASRLYQLEELINEKVSPTLSRHSEMLEEHNSSIKKIIEKIDNTPSLVVSEIHASLAETQENIQSEARKIRHTFVNGFLTLGLIGVVAIITLLSLIR